MRKFTLFVVAVVALTALQNARGELITYVDAVPNGNTVAAGGGSFYTSAWNNADGLWWYNDLSYYFNETGLEADSPDKNVPVLATTISGLTAGASYDVYGYYIYAYRTSAPSYDYDIQLGLSESSLTDYGTNGSGGIGMQLEGIDPATHFTNVSAIPSIHNYEVSLGTAVADAGGEIKVYVNESLTGSGCNDLRSCYDGVGYSLVPEPSTLILLTTGLIGLLCYAWKRRK